MSSQEDVQVFEGRGETLDEAFESAAKKALDMDRERYLGKEFQVVRHVVIIDNPRIREHKIAIGVT